MISYIYVIHAPHAWLGQAGRQLVWLRSNSLLAQPPRHTQVHTNSGDRKRGKGSHTASNLKIGEVYFKIKFNM